MEDKMQPHERKIRKAGKFLWVFSWIWMVINSLSCLAVIGAVVFLGHLGKDEAIGMAEWSSVPGLETEHVETIVGWDFAAFQDHYWMTLFYISYALVFFIISMVLILKIAASWKRCDVFGEAPIRNLRILGWVSLIHGVIGQVWGTAGVFLSNSKTEELLYFSFLRDTCFASFYMNGTGIEWGILALTTSWILKHAQLIREDQALVV